MPVMCNARVACDLVKIFGWPRLVFATLQVQTDNLSLICFHFSCSSPKCRFMMSVLRSGRYPHVKCHLGAKLVSGFLTSTVVVPLALNVLMTSHLWSGEMCHTGVTIADGARKLPVHHSLLRSKRVIHGATVIKIGT